MNIRGRLSRDEIDAFLKRTTVPVRVACRTPADDLWMLSLWYEYRDERLHCATSRDADVVGFIGHDANVAFEVSTNEPPYKGVRGRGFATVTDDPDKALLRDLLDRYLGDTETSTGRRLLSDERDEVTISIDPETVFGWDFSERMTESGD